MKSIKLINVSDKNNNKFYLKENVEDGEPIILVADFYENRLGE